jgi:hypothetical protein
LVDEDFTDPSPITDEDLLSLLADMPEAKPKASTIPTPHAHAKAAMHTVPAVTPAIAKTSVSQTSRSSSRSSTNATGGSSTSRSSKSKSTGDRGK